MENTLNWGKIKGGFSGFESLAFLYVKKNFRNSSWEETSKTRDGNKDGVAVIVGYQSDAIENQQWWMEAKYSNKTVNLTRYRLDATIVSAILEQNVAKIIFVTNVLIKPKTVADLRMTLSLATGYDDINFICKYDLEYWLFQNPQYMSQFFDPEDCIFNLPELFIINCAEYYYSSMEVLAFKESLQFLQKDIKYRMYFSIYSSTKMNSKIVPNPSLSGIKILSGKNVQIQPRENRLEVDFKLTEKFPGKRKKTYNSEPLFYIERQPINSAKLITVSDNPAEYILLEYQENILKNLKASLEVFNTKHNFILQEIIGNSGAGKSFIVNSFLQSKSCIQNGVYHFEFSNSYADNIIALLNLTLYIHFPYLAAEDIDINYLNDLKCNNYVSVCLKKLVQHREDFEELSNILAKIREADEIFPVNLYINSRILILDNVQKLKKIEKDFLFNIIQGLYARKAPVFILIIEQNSLQGMLYDKLFESVPLIRWDCQLESYDILKYLKKQPYFRILNDNLMNYQILFPNVIDLIMYLKYLRDIKEEISCIDDFYLSYHAFFNSDVADTYMLDIFNKLFSEYKSARTYCDIIFWSEYGYSRNELNEDVIIIVEKLLSQNLIKNNSYGDIIPCHDIYRMFYQKHFKPLTPSFLKSKNELADIISVISSNLFSINQIYDYSIKIRRLITEQKFYTVNYILENLFQRQDCVSIQNQIGVELYYELYILFAVSNTNISKSISGKKLFEEIYNQTKNSSNIRIIKVHEEATWELINSYYDSLMYDAVYKKIRELILTLNKLKKFGELSENLITNIRYHDIMVIKSLIEADTDFMNHYKFFSQRYKLMIKNKFNYRAVTYSVRYAQTIMRCMPDEALLLFKGAMLEIESSRGKSDKYYLWSAFGYYYMLIVFQNNLAVLNELIAVHELLKTNYFNDYRKKISGLATLFFQIGDIKRGNQYILSDAYVKREMRPRQKAFYYEALALSEILQNNYFNACSLLKKAKYIFKKIPDYKSIIQHNIDILEKESFSQNAIEYSFGKSLNENVYYLDPRCIW